jgi:hypothetical protein
MALLSAPYKEETISNFVERIEPAEGKVSNGAKYTGDSSEGQGVRESITCNTYW